MHCDNCGAEILSGHRFCRSCGRPTDDFAEEGTPTQMMPPEPPTRGPRDTATTSPSRGETNRVYAPPEQNYYQQQQYAPIHPPQPMPYYAPPPPRSRSPWGWIIAVIALFLIGAVGIAAFVISRANDPPRPPRTVTVPDPPPPPPPPPGSNEEVIGAGATTETRSFPFAARGGNLTLKTIKGNVTIEAWDEPRAEVRINKGSNAEVRILSDGSNLSLSTEPRGGVEVEYEIKLPRNVGRINIQSASADIALTDLTGGVEINNGNGQVTLSDISGKIKVNTGNGDISFADVQGELEANTGSGTIDMTDVNGRINANAANGDITVHYGGQGREPLTINTASGDIDVTFDSAVNADLSVKTLTGDIQVDESFSINVQKKQPVGTEARGRIGSGGQQINITTMAGDVRLRQQ